MIEKQPFYCTDTRSDLILENRYETYVVLLLLLDFFGRVMDIKNITHCKPDRYITLPVMCYSPASQVHVNIRSKVISVFKITK